MIERGDLAPELSLTGIDGEEIRIAHLWAGALSSRFCAVKIAGSSAATSFSTKPGWSSWHILERAILRAVEGPGR